MVVKNGNNSDIPGNFRELCEIITKASEVLGKNVQHLDNVLETLDVQQHSLGVLAVLLAKFNSPNVSLPDNRFLQAQEFLTNCNVEQVRSAPDLCKQHNGVYYWCL